MSLVYCNQTCDIPVAALAALQASFALRDSWISAEKLAVARFGAGPLTSGIGHASFADLDTRAHLRALIHAAQDAQDASLQAWRKAGRRAHTWRRWHDEQYRAWLDLKAHRAV